MVYSAPKEIAKPEFDMDSETYDKATRDYIKAVKDFCMQHGKGPDRGKIFTKSVGDGAAYYMIHSLSPVAIIHLEVYDGYQAPRMDKITAKEIRSNMEFAAKYGQHEFADI